MNSQKLTLIGAAVFALLFIIVLFLFALNGRYLIESSGLRIVVYDKWTGKHFYTTTQQREVNITDRHNPAAIYNPFEHQETHNQKPALSNSSRKGLSAFLEGAAGFIVIALIVLLYRFSRQKYIRWNIRDK